MISTTPEPMPVNDPVTGVIVAMVVLLLLHVPPGVRSDSVVDAPLHSEKMPDTGVIGLTSMTLDVVQLPML